MDVPHAPLQSFRLPGPLRSSTPLNISRLGTCLSIQLGKGVVEVTFDENTDL